MKKIVLSVAICLVFICMLLLGSCEYLPTEWFDSILPDGPFGSKEPKSAEELFERIDETFETVDSYRMDSASQIALYVDGWRLDVTADMDYIAIRNLGGTLYHYQKTTTSITSPTTDLDSITVSLMAYYAGNAFVKNVGDGIDQKLYSEMSADEYYDNFIDPTDNPLDDDDLLDCATKSFRKTEDGGWEIVCSGYTASFIKNYEKGVGLSELGSDHGISDIQLTMSCDESFLPKRVSVTIVFDVPSGSTATPSMEIVSNYSSFGEAAPVINELDVKDYNAVEDVYMLNKIEDLIEMREDSRLGYFTLTVENQVTLGGRTSTAREVDKISYGEKDGAYYFDIDYDIGQSSGKITYKNGVLSTGTNSISQSQEEARDYIAGLINSAKYNKLYVSSIVKNDTGYLIISKKPEENTYRQMLAQLGITYTSCSSQRIKYTITDGRITKISGEIAVYGDYQGTSATVLIITDVDFTATPNQSSGSAI